MPPFFSDPKSQPYFRVLNNLAVQLAALGLFADNAHVELSMGMSGDYAVAVEEGAKKLSGLEQHCSAQDNPK